MLATFFVMLVIFSMYKIGRQLPESVTNITNLSPTHLVSNIRHQHRCNPQNRLKIQIQSRFMSDATLSDIDFNNKMAFVWTTFKKFEKKHDFSRF